MVGEAVGKPGDYHGNLSEGKGGDAQEVEMINSINFCSELSVKLGYFKFYLICSGMIILKGSAQLATFSKVSNSRCLLTCMSRAS